MGIWGYIIDDLFNDINEEIYQKNQFLVDQDEDFFRQN